MIQKYVTMLFYTGKKRGVSVLVKNTDRRYLKIKYRVVQNSVKPTLKYVVNLLIRDFTKIVQRSGVTY